MQNLLRPQTYPYANSSVGPYRGLLVQRYPCWDAQGPARDKFENEIVAKIKECFEQCLPESNSFVGFSLFMVGKAPEKTKPTVMIVTDDKSRRKEAFKMVKSRNILSSYPGFELGHCSVAAEFEDLQRLGGNTEPSAPAPKSPDDDHHAQHMCNEYNEEPGNTNLVSAAVCAFECPDGKKATRLYFHTSPHLHSHEAGSATCNELFKIDGELYALTMAHAIQPPEHADMKSKQRDTHANSSSDSEDFEITGLDDWDEDDTNVLTTITSQGSKTSSEDSESENSIPYAPKPNSSTSSSVHTYSSSGNTYGSSRNTSLSSWSASIATGSVPTTYVAPGVGLPCEFIGYTGCDAIFDVDDVCNWIEHIISEHLRDKLPQKALCWFCDDIDFDYKRTDDKRTNFEQRMWHIRDHVIEEGRTANNMRPDHYLNNHLRDKGLIGEELYNAVRRYSEVPPYFVAVYGSSRRRSDMEYTDTSAEDRMLRRRRRGKSHTPNLPYGTGNRSYGTTTLPYRDALALTAEASEQNEMQPKKCTQVGSVIAVDTEMDIAVIKINAAIYGKGAPFARKLPSALWDPAIFSEFPDHRSITVKTTHHAQIKGQRSQMPFYTRLPAMRSFLELHSVKLGTPLRPGDSGSCAYNDQGAIIGFVLAGNPNSVSCMLLPAIPALRSLLSMIGKPLLSTYFHPDSVKKRKSRIRRSSFESGARDMVIPIRGSGTG